MKTASVAQHARWSKKWKNRKTGSPPECRQRAARVRSYQRKLRAARAERKRLRKNKDSDAARLERWLALPLGQFPPADQDNESRDVTLVDQLQKRWWWADRMGYARWLETKDFVYKYKRRVHPATLRRVISNARVFMP